MKYIISLLIICAFFVPSILLVPEARAFGDQVKITEIMYDLEGTDTDREWIEIQNVTAADINISGWKFYDGSNHLLNAPPANGGQGSLVIPSGGFAVITQNAVTFLSEHASYQGTVIDSVMALNNTGDTIRILDATNQVMDEVAYSSAVGAAGDGNTLSWYQGGWVAAVATPGAESGGAAPPPPPPPGGGNGGGNGGGGSSSTVKPVVFADSKKEPVWVATITPSVPALFSHVPFNLSAKITDPKKREFTTGRFVYILGDGRVIERNNNEAFGIEYQESGSYILYFEYYQDKKGTVPTVTEQLLLSIEDTPIDIIVSDNPYKIALANLHSTTIDVSGWVLADGKSTFTFPKHTLLPGNRQVTLNSRIHGLQGAKLTLSTPTSHVAAESSTTLISKTSPTKISPVQTQAIASLTPAEPTTQISPDVFSEIIPINEVFAHEKNDSTLAASTGRFVGVDRFTLFFIFFTLATALVLFFLLYSKKSEQATAPRDIEKENPDDYEIIEEEN